MKKKNKRNPLISKKPQNKNAQKNRRPQFISVVLIGYDRLVTSSKHTGIRLAVLNAILNQYVQCCLLGKHIHVRFQSCERRARNEPVGEGCRRQTVAANFPA